MSVHGSCAAFDDDAVLLLGDPGAGKSDLLLRLLDRGFALVGDDRVVIEGGRVAPVAALAGLLEVRGIGIFRLAWRESARLRLVVRLGPAAARLPVPEIDPDFQVPLIRIDPAGASAAVRVHWALDAAVGRSHPVCGAFVA